MLKLTSLGSITTRHSNTIQDVNAVPQNIGQCHKTSSQFDESPIMCVTRQTHTRVCNAQTRPQDHPTFLDRRMKSLRFHNDKDIRGRPGSPKTCDAVSLSRCSTIALQMKCICDRHRFLSSSAEVAEVDVPKAQFEKGFHGLNWCHKKFLHFAMFVIVLKHIYVKRKDQLTISPCLTSPCLTSTRSMSRAEH